MNKMDFKDMQEMFKSFSRQLGIPHPLAALTLDMFEYLQAEIEKLQTQLRLVNENTLRAIENLHSQECGFKTASKTDGKAENSLIWQSNETGCYLGIDLVPKGCQSENFAGIKNCTNGESGGGDE